MPKTQYIQQKEKSQPLFMKRGDILSEFFEISDKAREGGMGDVFFCRDRRDNKFYVLKTFKTNDLKQTIVLDEEGFPKGKKFHPAAEIALETFRKEALVALRMPRLPYVTFTKTLIADGTKQYLVMDFVGKQPRNLEEPVQGETLFRILKNTTIEYKQALIWGIEFCRGMQYLHKYGVPVHKDIKPENILLAPDNTIRIADFGLSALNKKGGTKGYLPPEYSEKQTLTEQSDIYSFGVVLYQLFNNVSVPKLNRNKVAENAILKKCLSVDPSSRYQSFAYLEKDLIKELKLQFPEYMLPASPKYSTTADEYFLKGLGVYLLQQYSKTFGQSIKEDLNLEAEKLLNKCLTLNPKHAAACYYHSKILIEESGLLLPLLRRKSLTHPTAKDEKIVKQVGNELRRAQENSAFYANLIELEHYRELRVELEDKNITLLKEFTKYSTKHPNYPYLHNNVGVFEAQMRHYREAVSRFTKAIKLLPDYAVAYANRASVYLWQNQEKKALKDCDKYTQLQRGKKTFIPLSLFLGIYVQIFIRYCRQEKYEKAYKWYEKHLELFPELALADKRKFLNRVRFQIQYHRLSHMPVDYNEKEILKEYRGMWRLYRQIQHEKLPIKSDDWFDAQEKQSLKLTRWAFQIRPNMENIFYHRLCMAHPTASILNEMGHYVAQWGDDYLSDFELMELSEHSNAKIPSYGKDAIPYFNKAITLDSAYAPAYYNRARAYMECKEYAKAIADYTTAIKLDPQHVFSSVGEHYISAMYGLIEGNPFERCVPLSHFDWVKKYIKTKVSSHYIGNHMMVESKTEYTGTSKPKIYDHLLVKAQFYYRLGKIQRALSYVEKAERMGAKLFQRKKGECYYKLGQYKEALNCFLKLTERELSHTAKANIALCYSKLGKEKESKKYFKLALDEFIMRVALERIPGVRKGIEKKTNREVLIKKVNERWVEVHVPEKLLKTYSDYFTNRYKNCLKNNHPFFILSYQNGGEPTDFAPLGGLKYNANAYFQRANAYFELKDYIHALEDYQKALDDIDRILFILGFESFIKERITVCRKMLNLT